MNDFQETGNALQRLASVRTAEQLDSLMSWLWGPEPSLRRPALLHVVAAVRTRGGDGPEGLAALRIEERTPRSRFDALALSVARARADAIVTTGKILREESELRHELLVEGALEAALRAWRQQGKGLTEQAPISLVLTSGRDLDLEHPLFAPPTRPVIFTSQEGRERVQAAGWREGGTVRVVAVEKPSPRGAVQWLREEEGASTVSLEAGPSTVAAFYSEEAPDAVAVDELLLSIYEEEVEDDLVGPDLPTWETVLRRLPQEVGRRKIQEDSGHWTFARRLRS